MPEIRRTSVARGGARAPCQRTWRDATDWSRCAARALDQVREHDLLAPRAAGASSRSTAPQDDGWLCLDGSACGPPGCCRASGRLTAVACAVATIGEPGTGIAELFAARRASLAVALDGLGNELLFALSRRLQDRMLVEAQRQALCMAGELRAGDPGLQLQAQHTVLQLAGAAAIDVTLTRTMMMNPTKSTSIIQGVGLALPAQSWSRCDHCRSRPRCQLAPAAS